MSRIAPGLALALLMPLACDRGGEADKRAPAAAADGAAEGEAKTKAEVKAKAKAKPGAAGKDGKARAAEVKAAARAAGPEARAARVEFNKLLGDGRKAVKAKDYEQGIALYREALALDPASPKLLGELGFAALRQGKLELAESSTRRAIDLAPEGYGGLGALYYNLGLIEEVRERPAEARAAFERSLAVRPGNAVVEGKLAKLGVETTKSGAAEPEALCKDAMAHWDCYASEAEIEALPAEDQDYAGLCECKVGRRLNEGTGESFIQAAAIIELTGMPGVGGSLDERYLGVRTAGRGWQLHDHLTTGYTPGVMGISNTGSIETFEFAELAPAPGEELHLRVLSSEVDTDMGSNTVDFFDSSRALLCYDAGDESGLCASFLSAAVNGTDVLLPDEAHDSSVSLGETRWELSIEFNDGEVAIAVVAGKDQLPDNQASWPGRRPLAETANLAGVTKIPLH